MNFKNLYIIFIFSVFLPIYLSAQDSTKVDIKDTDKSKDFVDNNNDGYNDNAPDHDGDGIPNALDPDWQKLQKKKAKKLKFVDLDGDGINDNIQNNRSDSEDIIQTQHKRIQQNQDGSSIENKSQNGAGQKKRGKQAGKR